MERIQNSGGEVIYSKHPRRDLGGVYRVYVKNKNSPGLAMSRSIGDRVAKTVGVINSPIKLAFNLKGGNFPFVVAASDGIWDVMTNSEVIDFIQHYTDK